MKRSIVLLVAVATVVCALAAQNNTPVPISQEPRHHLILENSKVKVYDVVVAPFDRTLLHQHDHDYVFVTLGDSDVDSLVLGTPPVIHLKLKDGEVRFAKAPLMHVARNKASTPFHNITIEILPTEPTGVQQPDPVIGAGTTLEPLFDQKVVRAWRFTMQPGAVLPKHTHNEDHLVVALSDLHLKSEVEGKGVSDLQQKRGGVVWVPGGYTHTLTNVGSTPAEFIGIDFK